MARSDTKGPQLCAVLDDAVTVLAAKQALGIRYSVEGISVDLRVCMVVVVAGRGKYGGSNKVLILSHLLCQSHDVSKWRI